MIRCINESPMGIRLQLGLGPCEFRPCFRCGPIQPRRVMDLGRRIADLNALVREIWRFREILKIWVV
jgi:hypothetical protein